MICESCLHGGKVSAVQLPNIPMEVSLCSICIAAGVVPYHLLVTSVWLKGGPDAATKNDYDIALYHGRSSTQFLSDLVNYIDKMVRDLEEHNDEDFGLGRHSR